MLAPMKIGIINRMLGTKWGGGERYDWELGHGLQSLGHEVHFFTASDPNNSFQLPPSPCAIHSVSIKNHRSRSYTLPWPLRSLNTQMDLLMFQWKLFSNLKETLKTIEAFHLCSLPLIGGHLKKKFPKATISNIFPGPPRKALAYLSGKLHITWANGIAYEKLRSFHTPNLKFLDQGISEKFLCDSSPWKKQTRQILSVGRLVPIKNPFFAIQFAEFCKKNNLPWKWSWIGEGQLEKTLKDQVKNKGLENHVEFLGYRSDQEILEALEKSFAVIIPSVIENNPIFLMEALAQNRPLVVNRASGLALCEKRYPRAVWGSSLNPKDFHEKLELLDNLKNDDVVNFHKTASDLRKSASWIHIARTWCETVEKNRNHPVRP